MRPHESLAEASGLGRGHDAAGQSTGQALIDDATLVPESARFNWIRTLIQAAAGLAICIALVGYLLRAFGWHGPLIMVVALKSLRWSAAVSVTRARAQVVLTGPGPDPRRNAKLSAYIMSTERIRA